MTLWGKMPLESPVLGVAVNFRTDTMYTHQLTHMINPADIFLDFFSREGFKSWLIHYKTLAKIAI